MDVILACLLCFSGDQQKISDCQSQAYWTSEETEVTTKDCKNFYQHNDGTIENE